MTNLTLAQIEQEGRAQRRHEELLAAELTGPCLEHARKLYDSSRAARGDPPEWGECLTRATRIAVEAWSGLRTELLRRGNESGAPE